MYFVPFSFITNLISGLLKTVINIFFSIFVNILPTILEVVLSLLQEILNAFLYELVFLPLLYVLETLQDAVEIFAGVRNVSYMGTQDNIFNIVLFRSGISNAFWIITLIGLIVAVLATIISVSRAGRDEKYTVSAILGRLGRTCLTFLMVPFVTICCINLTSLVFIKAGEMIEMASGYGGQITIPKVLFATTTINAERHTALGEGGLLGGARAPYINGTKDFRSVFQVFGQGKDNASEEAQEAIVDQEKKFSESKDANSENADEEIENIKNSEKYPGGDFNIAKMNVILGIILTAYFILLYCAAILLFVMRLMEITVLYTICPMFTGSIPFDDGEKFGQWREIFIGKLVSGFGLILGMKIYVIILLPMIMDSNVRFMEGSSFADMLLRVLMLAGFGYGAFKCFPILMQIVNPQLAQSEAELAGRAAGLVTGGVGAALRFSKVLTGDKQKQMDQIQQKQDAMKKK